MGAPSGDDLIGPKCGFANHGVIFRADGVGGFAHFVRVGVAPRKNVSDLKRPEAQRAGAPFAALHGGIVLNFGGFGRVEHDKEDAFAARVPRAGQGVAIAFAIRIEGGRGRVIFDMCACDHMFKRVLITRRHKHAAWLHFTATIDAHGDGFALEGGPNFIAVFHTAGDHRCRVAVA